MASPFKVFRKHQKAMLAVLGVLVMIGFVILPAIMQGMGGRNQTNPPVAKTTRYGDLHRTNLASLRWRRQIVLRFFDALGRELVRADASPAPVQFALREMTPNQDLSPTSDEALVETWLLARRAEELGLVVNDEAINAFLSELMQGRMTSDGIAAVLDRAEISDNDLFSVLRQELLAMRLRRIFRVSLQGSTPAERWDYFQRLNRKVTIESAPVEVVDFLKDVSDPDESTLHTFFEQHKAEPHDPTSPEPGFREPRKVAIEYLKAEYEAFFDRELKAVTPEEVEKYYAEHKEDYKQEKLPTLEEKEPDATDSEAEAAAAKPGDEPPPSGEKPAATEPPDQAPPTSSNPPGDASSNSDAGASPFRLASLVEEGAEEKSTPEPETAPQAADLVAAEPQYLPLEKVEEEIRASLAREKTTAAIENLLNKLRAELEAYHDKLILFEVKGKSKEGDKSPAKPDFDKLAKQHGLIAGKPGLVSAFELGQLDIGKSSLGPQAAFVDAVFEQVPKDRPEIAQDTEGNYYLFWKTDEAEETVPELNDEGVRERMLREWKKIEARSLARNRADAMAEEARKAKKPLNEVFAGRADVVVTESEPFSWLTYGAIQPWMAYGPPSISGVRGVDTPGNDFMRAVFDLDKGEVGTAMNHPQTVAYVVRVTDSNPLPDVLWSQFLSESYFSYFRAAWPDQSRAETAWLDGIKSEVGFAWDPDWQRESPRR